MPPTITRPSRAQLAIWRALHDVGGQRGVADLSEAADVCLSTTTRILAALTRAGHVQSWKLTEPDRPPRTVFWLTPAGRRHAVGVLRAHG